MSIPPKKESGLGNSQIIAAAGHDLRQPIHALNLILDTLAERATDAEIAGLVKNAQVSADGVTSVLEALLGVAAMDAGEASPTIGDINVNDLFDHLRDQYTRRAKNKGLDLRIVPSALRVRSDGLLLQRVLDTLISNALHYTENGRILLGCRRSKNMLRIGVLDSGPGVSEEMAAHYSGGSDQVGEFSKSHWRGYALGLSISQSICAVLGHHMAVVSRKGDGAAIWLTVPLAEVQSDREPRIAPDSTTAGLEVDALIVVMEDDPDVLLATTQFLESWGYRVCGGGTAAAVIQDIATNGGGACPDLVLSDFNFPDGHTAVDAMAELNRHFNEKIPAIIITGDPSAPGIADAQAQNYEILLKPLRAAKLRALVRYALAQRS